MSVLSINRQTNTQPLVNINQTDVPVDVKSEVNDTESAALTLYDNGMIRDGNQEVTALFGYSANQLTGQHIIRLLPQLAEIKLIQDKRANSYLRFLSRMGRHFEAVRMNDTNFTCTLFFNDVTYLGRHFIRVIICPVK
ncbi:MAG: hypothetical protein K0U40_10210 [Betaproteobacteria bacterium]|nr:hypothetical protein [Betaproteobacteria bacterium]